MEIVEYYPTITRPIEVSFVPPCHYYTHDGLDELVCLWLLALGSRPSTQKATGVTIKTGNSRFYRSFRSERTPYPQGEGKFPLRAFGRVPSRKPRRF